VQVERILRGAAGRILTGGEARLMSQPQGTDPFCCKSA